MNPFRRNSHIHLQGLLPSPDSAGEQHSSKPGEHQTRGDSGLPGTELAPVATTLAPDAILHPETNLVQSNNPNFRPAPIPEASQVSFSGRKIDGGSSRRGELLNGANKALKLAETVSGALPVVGSYVGVVAKVGLTIVEMVQVSALEFETVCSLSYVNVQAMDENDETAERLGARVCHLSDVLKMFSNRPDQQEHSQTTNAMEGLQQSVVDLVALLLQYNDGHV